jgi:hypothetical protein
MSGSDEYKCHEIRLANYHGTGWGRVGSDQISTRIDVTSSLLFFLTHQTKYDIGESKNQKGRRIRSSKEGNGCAGGDARDGMKRDEMR